nr:MAG TPA: hypothetical protein [Caudoviricetes sp.]
MRTLLWWVIYDRISSKGVVWWNTDLTKRF